MNLIVNEMFVHLGVDKLAKPFSKESVHDEHHRTGTESRFGSTSTLVTQTQSIRLIE